MQNKVRITIKYVGYFRESAQKARRLTDKIRVYLKTPGWFPAEQGGPQAPPPIEDDPAKFDLQYPRAAGEYVFFQFGLVTAVAVGLLFMAGSYGFATTLAGAVAITWGLINLGGLFETRAWAYRSEAVRIWVVPLVALILLSGVSAWAWAALLSLGILVFGFRLLGLREIYLAGHPAASSPEGTL